MTIVVCGVSREVDMERGFECWAHGKLAERFATYAQAWAYATAHKGVTVRYKLLPLA